MCSSGFECLLHSVHLHYLFVYSCYRVNISFMVIYTYIHKLQLNFWRYVHHFLTVIYPFYQLSFCFPSENRLIFSLFCIQFFNKKLNAIIRVASTSTFQNFLTFSWPFQKIFADFGVLVQLLNVTIDIHISLFLCKYK